MVNIVTGRPPLPVSINQSNYTRPDNRELSDKLSQPQIALLNKYGILSRDLEIALQDVTANPAERQNIRDNLIKILAANNSPAQKDLLLTYLAAAKTRNIVLGLLASPSANVDTVLSSRELWNGGGAVDFVYRARGENFDTEYKIIGGKVCYYEHGRINISGNITVKDGKYMIGGEERQIQSGRLVDTAAERWNSAPVEFVYIARGETAYTEYKIIDGKVCYFEDGQVKVSQSITRVEENGEFKYRVKESIYTANAKENEYVINKDTHELVLKQSAETQTAAAVTDSFKDSFNNSKEWFLFRFTDQLTGREDADLTEIRCVDGQFWYKQGNEFYQAANLSRGADGKIYYGVRTQDGKISREEQIVHDKQLVPKKYYDLVTGDPPAVHFSLRAIHNTQGGLIEKFATKYVVDENDTVWYFQNGQLQPSKSITEDNLEFTLALVKVNDQYDNYILATGKRDEELEQQITDLQKRGRETGEYAGLISKCQQLVTSLKEKTPELEAIDQARVRAILANERSDNPLVNEIIAEIADLTREIKSLGENRTIADNQLLFDKTNQLMQKIKELEKLSPANFTEEDVRVVSEAKDTATDANERLFKVGKITEAERNQRNESVNRTVASIVSKNNLQNIWLALHPDGDPVMDIINAMAAGTAASSAPLLTTFDLGQVPAASAGQTSSAVITAADLQNGEALKMLNAAIDRGEIEEALMIARGGLDALEKLIAENSLAGNIELSKWLGKVAEAFEAIQSILSVSARPVETGAQTEPNIPPELLPGALKNFVSIMQAAAQNRAVPGSLETPASGPARQQTSVREGQQVLQAMEFFTAKIVETRAVSVVVMALVITPDFLAGQPMAIRRDLALLLPLIRAKAEIIVQNKIQNEELVQRREEAVREEMAKLLTPFAKMIFLGELVEAGAEFTKDFTGEPLSSMNGLLGIADLAVEQSFQQTAVLDARDALALAKDNALRELLSEENSREFLLRNFAKLSPAQKDIVIETLLAPNFTDDNNTAAFLLNNFPDLLKLSAADQRASAFLMHNFARLTPEQRDAFVEALLAKGSDTTNTLEFLQNNFDRLNFSPRVLDFLMSNFTKLDADQQNILLAKIAPEELLTKYAKFLSPEQLEAIIAKLSDAEVQDLLNENNGGEIPLDIQDRLRAKIGIAEAA